jgi:hypothetical protein
MAADYIVAIHTHEICHQNNPNMTAIMMYMASLIQYMPMLREASRNVRCVRMAVCRARNLLLIKVLLGVFRCYLTVILFCFGRSRSPKQDFSWLRMRNMRLSANPCGVERCRSSALIGGDLSAIQQR